MYAPYYTAIALCFPIQRSDRTLNSQTIAVSHDSIQVTKFTERTTKSHFKKLNDHIFKP